MGLLYGFCHHRRRRNTALRILVITALLWICYYEIATRFQNPVYANDVQDGSSSAIDAQFSYGLQRAVFHAQGDSSFKEEKISPEKTYSIYEDTIEDCGKLQVPLPPARLPVRDKGTDEDTTYSFPNTLRNALQTILSLMPDELHGRNLLQPITQTGEEKIHEIGLRARSFKKLFEAWEALHLIPGQETVYIRDDVVQSLRSHLQVAKSLGQDVADIIRSYENYRFLLRQLSTLLFPWIMPYYSDHMALHAQLSNGKRGIVFSAGNKQVSYLLTSIRAIRQLGCDLPVEVMYLGDDDLSEDLREEMELLPGVVTRDLSLMIDDEGWTLRGWAAKPFAILLSSFREVIFIDADSLFLQNPDVLFQHPSYQETGALFFKDRLFMPQSKKGWLQRILPKPISKNVRETRLWTGESGHMQESGVIVVDKWKHFVALLMVTRLNGPDRNGNKAEGKVGVYDMVYGKLIWILDLVLNVLNNSSRVGDKETFWLGWELVGDTDYAFHNGETGIIGAVKPESRPDKPKQEPTPNEDASTLNSTKLGPDLEPTKFTICGPQLLHLDTDNRPLWFNGWLLPNKFSNEKNPIPDRFNGYITEPHSVHDAGGWQLGKNNVCCLTSENVTRIVQEDADVLEMIIHIAEDVGAIGKR